MNKNMFFSEKKDWLLKHLLILSSGYILIMLLCLIYGITKCVNWFKVISRQSINEMEDERRENTSSIEMSLLK